MLGRLKQWHAAYNQERAERLATSSRQIVVGARPGGVVLQCAVVEAVA